MRPFVEGHYGRLNGEKSTPTGDPRAPSWPDDPNSPTGKVEAWSHGGGAPWQSASFDPETNTIIIGAGNPAPWNTWARRSEEHTSELQSRPHLVCRLLLEKKK